MKTKFIHVLIRSLVLLVSVTLVTLSLISCSSVVSDNSKAEKNSENTSEETAVSESKIFTTYDGATVELKLNDDQSSADNGEISYNDKDENTYVFDSSNNLVSIRISNYEDEALSAMRDDPSLRIEAIDAKNKAVSFANNILPL